MRDASTWRRNVCRGNQEEERNACWATKDVRKLGRLPKEIRNAQTEDKKTNVGCLSGSCLFTLLTTQGYFWKACHVSDSMESGLPRSMLAAVTIAALLRVGDD